MQLVIRSPSLRKCSSIVLALLFLFALWTPVRGQKDEAGRTDVRIMMLQQQVNDLDRRIDQAESELRSLPSFNWCCCIGWNLFFPLGTIIWLVTDVQSHSDAKKALQDKIARLQSDKQNLQNQIMMLQSDK